MRCKERENLLLTSLFVLPLWKCRCAHFLSPKGETWLMDIGYSTSYFVIRYSLFRLPFHFQLNVPSCPQIFGHKDHFSFRLIPETKIAGIPGTIFIPVFN